MKKHALRSGRHSRTANRELRRVRKLLLAIMDSTNMRYMGMPEHEVAHTLFVDIPDMIMNSVPNLTGRPQVPAGNPDYLDWLPF